MSAHKKFSACWGIIHAVLYVSQHSIKLLFSGSTTVIFYNLQRLQALSIHSQQWSNEAVQWSMKKMLKISIKLFEIVTYAWLKSTVSCWWPMINSYFVCFDIYSTYIVNFRKYIFLIGTRQLGCMLIKDNIIISSLITIVLVKDIVLDQEKPGSWCHRSKAHN